MREEKKGKGKEGKCWQDEDIGSLGIRFGKRI